jgi:ribonuclease HII
LTAAAVLVPRDPRERARLTRALNQESLVPRDSKQLSHSQRIRVVEVLRRLSIPIAVADIPPERIDELGLGVANRLAMQLAIAALEPAPEHALVDAFRLPELPCSHESIVRGDAQCLSIALASIVAKTHRDALMMTFDRSFPSYGFADHKGYGTATHAAALSRHGVTELHRRSFAPIAALLSADE